MKSSGILEDIHQKIRDLADAIDGLTDAWHDEGVLDKGLEITYNLVDLDVQISNLADFNFYVGTMEDISPEVCEEANSEYNGQDEDADGLQ